jgi:hypothetical protein
MFMYSNSCNQGYFCDGTRLNAVPEVLSQKDATRNDVSEPSLPGIYIAKPHLRSNFGSLCVPELSFFFFKGVGIVLVVTGI